MKKASAKEDDLYKRALRAERRLRPIAKMVDLLCATAPTDRAWCYACIWEGILKPMMLPLIGDGRGYIPESASDGPRELFKVITAAELEAMEDRLTPAETDTESWMRSSEAWDAVSNRWLRALEAADPALGHGVPQAK